MRRLARRLRPSPSVQPAVARPGSALHDTIVEALADLRNRPGRVALTALGVAIGVGALVATLAVAETARARISSRFDEVRSTEVTVTDLSEAEQSNPFPIDTPSRVARIPGARAGGVLWSLGNLEVSRLAPSIEPEATPALIADEGSLQAAGVQLTSGRFFVAADNRTKARSALLGLAAAQRLGVSAPGRDVAIRVAGIAYEVVGIVEDSETERGIALSVVLNSASADELWAPGEPRRVIVRTDPGAASVVSQALAMTLRPERPEDLGVQTRADAVVLRSRVEADTSALVLALAGISLLVGTVGIANTTLVSVLERTNEIGLRRALGARRRDIASQFLMEASVTGCIGGLVGTCVGVVVVLGVSAARGWNPVASPALLLTGVPLGALVGVVAGAWPAAKAARIEPVAALRR